MKKRNQNDRPSNDKMKELFSRAVEMELDQCETEEKVQKYDIVELEMEEIGGLAGRIGLLPPPDQSLFYFHYCFDISDESAGEILGITRPLAKRIYLENILSAFLLDMSDSEENYRIGEESMKQACEKALLEYTDYNPADFTGFPVYSKRFRKRLKKIRAAQKTDRVLPLLVKRVAVVFIVFTMGISTVMVTDAGFREIVAEWFVEAFEEFTRFRMENIEFTQMSEVDKALGEYKVEFIPEGFYEVKGFYGNTGRSIHYENDYGEQFLVKIVPKNVIHSYNTEDSEVKTININDSTVCYWEKDNQLTLRWWNENFEFSIVTNLSFDTACKIAENIKR